MKPVIKFMGFALLALGFTLPSKAAMASTDGILLLGTQSEVRHMLKGQPIKLAFSENNPRALVAVRLTRNEATVYEHDAVDRIIKFVGRVVKGGVCITLEAGCDLWNLLEDTAGVVIDTGICVAHAVRAILHDGAWLIIDGTTFVVKTAADCVEAVADFVRGIFH